MSKVPVHTCADKYCPVYGQPTRNTCGCHKTSEQMLLAQRDTYETALRKIVSIKHANLEAYCREADSIALDALASAEAV